MTRTAYIFAVLLVVSLADAQVVRRRPPTYWNAAAATPETTYATIVYDTSAYTTWAVAADSARFAAEIKNTTDRIAIFSIFSNQTPQMDSVTWTVGEVTQTFTVIGVQGKVEQWYLVAPTAGVGYCKWWHLGASQTGSAGLAMFSGVDQTTPLGTQAKATATSTDVTVDVTTTVGDVVVDITGNGSGYAYTKDASQTTAWFGDNAGGDDGQCTYELASTTTTTMSGTLATSYAWAIAAVPLKRKMTITP